MKLDSTNLPPNIVRAQNRQPALRQPSIAKLTGTAEPNPACACSACNPEAWWMVLCSICGNKRCPHAQDHRFVCSGSNKPGQTPKIGPSCSPQPRQHAPDAKSTTDSGLSVAPETKRAGGQKRVPGLSKPRGRKGMNRTEQAFALRLEAMKQAGEIVRHDFEGVTLRLPDGLAYTPDFAAWEPVLGSYSPPAMVLFETKGAYIRPDSLTKFRAFRAYFPQVRMEMWQLKKGQWTRLL